MAAAPDGGLAVLGSGALPWGNPLSPQSPPPHDDLWVAKLDGTGALVWSTYLGLAQAGSVTSYTDAPALVFDSGGNLLIAGTSRASFGQPLSPHNGANQPTAFVVKLDAGGKRLWNTFLGTAGAATAAGGVAVQGNLIYVSGTSDRTWGWPRRGFGDGTDAFVSALDSSGKLIWNTFLGCTFAPITVGGPFPCNDRGARIVADSAGNAYVVGDSYDFWGTPIRYGGGQDAFVAKLSPKGVLLWLAFLGGRMTDIGRSIALDAAGNVIVVSVGPNTWGKPVRPPNDQAYFFVAKLTNDGKLLWNTDLFPGRVNTWALPLAVSPSGEIYVAKLGVVAKLAAGGALLWETAVAGADSVHDSSLAIDSAGNPIVVGSAHSGASPAVRAYSGGHDGYVAQLAPANGAVTRRTYLGGSGSFDGVSGVAYWGADAAYFVGTSFTSWGAPVRAYTPSADPEHATGDAFVVKTDGQGRVLWTTFLGSPATDRGRAIATDAAGNVYVLGYSWTRWDDEPNPYSFGLDVFVARLTSEGVLQWVRFLGGYGEDSPAGLALDTAGNVYVVGSSYSFWGHPIRMHTLIQPLPIDGFAAKLSPDGALLWNTYLGGKGVDNANAITVSGNTLYIAGSSAGSWAEPIHAAGPGGDGFVAALTTDGALLWNTFVGTDYTDTLSAITVDAGGQPIVAGSVVDQTAPDAQRCDGLVAKVDAGGNPLWLQRITQPAAGNFNAVYPAAGGSIYAAGSTVCSSDTGQSGKANALLLKLGSDGTPEQTTYLGGAGRDEATGVAFVDDTHLLVGGYSAAGWGAPVRGFAGDVDGFGAYLLLSGDFASSNAFLYLPHIATGAKE